MPTTDYPFDTPNLNWDYDNDKVTISGGLMKLIPGDESDPTDYTEEFTTPGDYTYDSTKVEVTGGKAQLKLDWHLGETFVTHQNGDGVPEYHKGGTITSITASGGANWNAVNKKYGTHSLNINTAGSRLEYIFEEGSELQLSEDGQSGSFGMWLAFKNAGQVGFIFDVRNRAGSHNYRIMCYWNTSNFSLFVYNSVGTQVLFYESNNIPAPTLNVFYHLFVTFRLDEFNYLNTVAKIYWNTVDYGDKAYNTRGIGIQANGAHDILTLGDPSLALPPGMPGSTQAAAVYIDEFLCYDSYRDDIGTNGIIYYHYLNQPDGQEASKLYPAFIDMWGDPTSLTNIEDHEIYLDELTGDPLGFHGFKAFSDIVTISQTFPDVRIVGYVIANDYTGPVGGGGGGPGAATFYYWDTVTESWEEYTGFAFLGDGTPNINLASEINTNVDTFPPVEEDKCMLVKVVMFTLNVEGTPDIDSWTRTCTSNRYWTDEPLVTMKAGKGFQYDEITSNTFTYSEVLSSIDMQVSFTSGATGQWFYYDNGWKLGGDGNYSNIADVEANLDTFSQGNFFLRFKLISDDGTKTPTLSLLSFTYTVPYPPEPIIDETLSLSTSNYPFQNEEGYTFDNTEILFSEGGDNGLGQLELLNIGTVGTPVYVESAEIEFPSTDPTTVKRWYLLAADVTLATNTNVFIQIQFSSNGGTNWGALWPNYNDMMWIPFSVAALNEFRDVHIPGGSGNDKIKIKIRMTSDGSATPFVKNLVIQYYKDDSYKAGDAYTPKYIKSKENVMVMANNKNLKLDHITDYLLYTSEMDVDIYIMRFEGINPATVYARHATYASIMELAASYFVLGRLSIQGIISSYGETVQSMSGDNTYVTLNYPASISRYDEGGRSKNYSSLGQEMLDFMIEAFLSGEDTFDEAYYYYEFVQRHPSYTRVFEHPHEIMEEE
jgi:hypothetical protein